MPVMITSKILQQCYEINETHLEVEFIPSIYHNVNDLMSCAGYMLIYFEYLSNINHLNHDEAFRRIFPVLTMHDHKRLELVFMGSTKSGKPQLVDIIKSAFSERRIGQVNGPTGNKLTDFWLQEARTCDTKVMEELKMPNEQIAQHFNEFLESNTNLMANRKYKDPLPIPRTQIIISMNGNQLQDILEFCSNEWTAFDKRIFCLLFIGSLGSIVGQRNAINIPNHGKETMQHLRRIFKDCFPHVEESIHGLSSQDALLTIKKYMGK